MRRTVLTAVLLAAASAAGAQSSKVTLLPTSSLTVEGSSNVHEWKATSTALTADIVMAAPADATSKVESVTLSLPVTSLKSGKGGLDKNMYKALHADEHPTISYRMTTYTSTPDGSKAAAKVSGLLTVNGVEKEIPLTATISSDGKGGLQAVGSTKFLMTDFGVKPVTALFGTIRTSNEVTITFDLSGAIAKVIAQLPQE